jgi:hypothetical protein
MIKNRAALELEVTGEATLRRIVLAVAGATLDALDVRCIIRGQLRLQGLRTNRRLFVVTGIGLLAGARLVNFEAPRTGERLAKHNYILRLEEEFGPSAQFAGPEVFAS